MKEILFRAKRVLDNEWIYGGLIHQTDYYETEANKYFIIDGTRTYDYDIGEPEAVFEETVGQYIGLIVELLMTFSHKFLASQILPPKTSPQAHQVVPTLNFLIC